MSTTNLRESFVTPQLCKQLEERGLTPATWAEYRIYGKDCTYLVSRSFDPDNLYEHVMFDHTFLSPYITVPAYTMADMFTCIPGITVLQIEMNYIVHPAAEYNQQPTSDSWLPDALAKMVDQLLANGCMTSYDMNSLILKANSKTYGNGTV